MSDVNIQNATVGTPKEVFDRERASQWPEAQSEFAVISQGFVHMDRL